MKAVFWGHVLGLMIAAISPNGIAFEIENVRIAFEPQKNDVLVRQMVALKPDEGDGESAIPLPLPTGARKVNIAQDDEGAKVTIEGSTLLIPSPLPDEGRAVQFMYRLPILDGVVALDQSLKKPIPVAHAALVGVKDSVTIRGNGFSDPTIREAPDGIPTSFIVAAQIKTGHLQILLTGFDADYSRYLIILATVLSFGMLAVGFVFWLRRVIRPVSADG